MSSNSPETLNFNWLFLELQLVHMQITVSFPRTMDSGLKHRFMDLSLDSILEASLKMGFSK